MAAERLRQIQAEGWSSDHDDEHEDGTIVDAAICYAQATNPDQYGGGSPPPGWPWLAKYWKPGAPIRMLVKAAALLVADIDRRLRAGEGSDLDDAPDPIATLTAERDAAIAERDALRAEVAVLRATGRVTADDLITVCMGDCGAITEEDSDGCCAWCGNDTALVVGIGSSEAILEAFEARERRHGPREVAP